MTPVVSIVGKSEAGKTRLIEGLLPEFKRRGYRVAVVKHHSQEFEFDQKGKDSWRLAQAGSDAVVLSSPNGLVLIRPVKQDFSLEELSHFLGPDYDLILAESFKHSKVTKIEVHKKELGKDLISSPQELLALVTDETLDLPLPQYAPEDFRSLADFIEQKFLVVKEEAVTLSVNGNLIPLNPFVKEFFTKTLLGMVSALKGVKEIRAVKTLDIRLRR